MKFSLIAFERSKTGRQGIVNRLDFRLLTTVNRVESMDEFVHLVFLLESVEIEIYYEGYGQVCKDVFFERLSSPLHILNQEVFTGKLPVVHEVIYYGLIVLLAKLFKVDSFGGRSPLELEAASFNLAPTRSSRFYDPSYKLMIIVTA